MFILTTVNLAYESLQNGKLTEEISKETEIEETLEVDKDTNFETFLNINYANLELWQIEIPKIDLIAPIPLACKPATIDANLDASNSVNP